VVHGGGVVGEQLEQAHSLVHSMASGERHAQHHLLTVVVGPVVELEVAALLRSPHAPAGENARDRDDVLLSVAAVYAEGVQLEQLTRVVLVDALRHALGGLPAQRVGAHRIPPRIEQRRAAEHRARAEQRPGTQPHGLRRHRARGHALPVVQVKQHRGALGRRDQEVLELA